VNWWRRLWNWRKLDTELDAELRDHIDRLSARFVREGASEGEARRNALLEFGGLAQIQEACRDARGAGWIHCFLKDIGFARRILLKDPGFTAIAIVTIALAIGANTAVFSVADAILFKPLPYRYLDRIVSLATLWRPTGNTGPISIPDFSDWQREATAFSAMAYYTDYDTTVGDGATAVFAHLARVSPKFFQVFGVEPAVGRLFIATSRSPEALASRSSAIPTGEVDSAATRTSWDARSRYMEGPSTSRESCLPVSSFQTRPTYGVQQIPSCGKRLNAAPPITSQLDCSVLM